MEFVCIEAKAFMEMNEALEAVEKKMRETCGGGICSMDDWIDNQEACMLMNVSPRKLLQLRRSRIIPYSHIDRKVYYRRLSGCLLCLLGRNQGRAVGQAVADGEGEFDKARYITGVRRLYVIWKTVFTM